MPSEVQRALVEQRTPRSAARVQSGRSAAAARSTSAASRSSARPKKGTSSASLPARTPSRARARRPPRRPPRRPVRCRRRRRDPSARRARGSERASPVSACARRSPSSRSPSARFRITSTPAKPSRCARRKSCASSALGSTSVITPGSRVTAPPERRSIGRAAGGERQLERQQVVAGRVVRLAVLGDRGQQLGHRPREPLRVPGTLELERRDLAVAIELEEVRAEQDAAADRALGAVDPERRAAARGRASPTVRMRTFAPLA